MAVMSEPTPLFRSQANSVETLRLDLLRRFGPHVLPLASAASPIATGYPELDQALHTGGLPRGRIVELLGDDAGKLSLTLRLLAGVTSRGGLAAIIDPAGALYPPSAAASGVHLANLAVIQPVGLPRSLDALATLLQTEGFDVLVYDLPRGAKEPNAAQLTRLASLAARTSTLLLALASTTTSRLRAGATTHRPLSYFASIRLLVERRAAIWRPGLGAEPVEATGYTLLVSVLKHKLAAPGASVELVVSPWKQHGDDHDTAHLPHQLPVAATLPSASLAAAAV